MGANILMIPLLKRSAEKYHGQAAEKPPNNCTGQRPADNGQCANTWAKGAPHPSQHFDEVGKDPKASQKEPLQRCQAKLTKYFGGRTRASMRATPKIQKRRPQLT